jgi:hypothetical protein
MESLTDIRALLEDALLESGIPPTERLLDRLEAVAEASGFEVGGRLLGDLIARLDVRQRRLWERLLETAPTLDECAAELGVSKVAVHRQEHRLRERLTPRRRVDEQSNTAPSAERPGKIQNRPQDRRQAGRA